MNTFSEAEWNTICDEVAKVMSCHVQPFTTPISKVLSNTHGKHHGTASYFHTGSEKYLITNEHVVRHLANDRLTYKFNGNDDLFLINNPASTITAPVDVAIIRIDDEIWCRDSHNAAAIPLSRFAKSHEPVQHELLFFAGFSGYRSKFLYGHLITPGTPYVTQESSFPTTVNEANPIFHFSLFYPPDLARSVDGSSSLPEPHGFSGSLVWDTKRVACLQKGTEWSPEIAEVTGIVWGWPSGAGCVLATKVEKLGIKELVEPTLDKGQQN
jgi:hypothetical protein